MNILVTVPVLKRHKEILEKAAPSATFVYAARGMENLLEEQVHSADIIIGNPPVSLVAGSKRLKLLQLQSAGVGQYTQPGILSEGTILVRAGAYGLAISECMLGTILMLFKKLNLYRDNQARSEWMDMGNVRTIYNATALIVGLGDIGGELAKKLKALGAYTIGIKRNDLKKPEYVEELYSMEMLEKLLPRADIVALSLPETAYTMKIINENTLKLMKTDAILINVGRGSAVDTEALCDALESGQIWGAALDVTDPQPLPKDHRLWGIKNAVITPHVFGGLHLQETHDRIINIAAANLDAFLHGGDLINVVDMSEGY